MTESYARTLITYEARRKLWAAAYCVGVSQGQIAKLEQVTQQAVMSALRKELTPDQREALRQHRTGTHNEHVSKEVAGAVMAALTLPEVFDLPFVEVVKRLAGVVKQVQTSEAEDHAEGEHFVRSTQPKNS